MRRLGEALAPALKALGIVRRTREAQALWLWPTVVGPMIARETEAVRLSNGTLWVQASSAPLAHQLHIEQSLLIDRLNRGIGMPVVREIRFRQVGRR